MSKPTIAITMGDAAGIGPELIFKTLAEDWVWEACHPLVVGDPAVMARIEAALGTGLAFCEVAAVTEARYASPTVDVFCPEGARLGEVTWGDLDAACGEAAARCLAAAYDLVVAGEVQGVVSAPLNKEAFHLAGYDFADELAFLADHTASEGTYMMGAMGQVFTLALSEHVAFGEIQGRVTLERVAEGIARMHRVLVGLGTAARIAVAALNPHGGEGGTCGREEIDAIAPAIEAARAEGLNVTGPVPADMVFPQALGGRFDGVVCMFHDQANIARKLQPMREGATLLVGLPAPAATTAHGTAFDVAGQGIADPGSLQAALRHTVALAGG